MRTSRMRLVVVILAMLGLCHLCVTGAIPTKCCMMNQWEAIMGTVDVRISSQSQDIRPGTKYISMDYENKLFAVTTFYADGEHMTNKFIDDFSNKKQYNIDGENCTVSSLYLNMLPQCIPADARYLGSSYIGGGAATIPFDSWNYFIAGWNVNISVSVSQGDCVPLAEEVLTHNTDFKSSMSAVFTTFTPGIKDPNVFVPPPNCQPGFPKETVDTSNTARTIQQPNRT